MQEEFQRFAVARWGALFRLAFLLCGDRHMAEDLVQQTMERAFAAWTRVSNANEPAAYVRRIMINEHTRIGRRHRREALTSDVPEPPGVQADGTDWAGTREVLLAALADLPLRQRQTVVLRYWEDMSEAQTAAALECSIGTVKSQTAKGIAKLRSIPALAALIAHGDRS